MPMKKILFPVSLMALATAAFVSCGSHESTPDDAVRSTFNNLLTGNYGDVARMLYTDSALAMSDADTAAFADAMRASLDGLSYQTFDIDTVIADDSTGVGAFRLTLLLADNTTVATDGKLRKDHTGAWKLDVAKTDTFTRALVPVKDIAKGVDIIPHMRHAYAKVQAPKGDDVSLLTMARYSLRGYWEPLDTAAYIKNLRLAAEKGNPEAMYAMSLAYSNGTGVAVDYMTSEEWCDKAAAKGHMKAKDDMLWNMLSGSRTQKRDPAKAFELAQKELAAGNPYAKFFLAYCYSNGKGTKRDKAKALKMYEELALAGDGLAAYNLGVNAERTNKAEAFKWYKMGADANDAQCIRTIGMMYERGYGVPADKKKAAEIYRRWLTEFGDSAAVWFVKDTQP